MTKLLITGSSGFIGSHLIEKCISDYAFRDVVGIDKVSIGNAWWAKGYEGIKGWQSQEFDLTSLHSGLENAFERVDAVIHLAALTSVDLSILHPTKVIANNVLATATVLEMCRTLEIPKLILVSTDEVYGEIIPPEVASENNPIRPGNPYSASKAASEHLCNSYSRTYGTPVCILRICNVYGPRQTPDKLIPRAIATLVRGADVPIYGDGTQARNWIHVHDAVEAILLALTDFKARTVFNVSTDDQITSLDIVKLIHDSLGIESLNVQFVEDRPGHDRVYSTNAFVFSQEFSWIPRTPISAGLPETVNWFRNRTEDLEAEYKRSVEEN